MKIVRTNIVRKGKFIISFLLTVKGQTVVFVTEVVTNVQLPFLVWNVLNMAGRGINAKPRQNVQLFVSIKGMVL